MLTARRVGRLERNLFFCRRIYSRSSCLDLGSFSVVRPNFHGHIKIWGDSISPINPEKANRTSSRSVHGEAARETDVDSGVRWTIVHRPILETLLKSYAHHPTVVQPLILHGPRGVGKLTVIEGLVGKWNKAPHFSAYVDLYFKQNGVPPWTSSGRFGAVSADDETENDSFPGLRMIRGQLEHSLELLAWKAIELGHVESDHVLEALLERHAIDGALKQFLRVHGEGSTKVEVASSTSTKEMWREAIQVMREVDEGSFRANAEHSTKSSLSHEVQPEPGSRKPLSGPNKKSKEDASVSLVLAKQILKIQEDWRVSSEAHRKSQGIFARASADASTSWAVLLLQLLSSAVKEGHFQPKLVINNLDAMRNAAADIPEGTPEGALYHDSLLMQLTKIGTNGGCIPTIFVSSDSYYSCKLYADHGDEVAFISQEAFGWTPKEAAVHLVPAVFEESEWKVITSVLGSNARHLAELHSIWHSPSFLEILEESSDNAMEECIALYLGYLQVTAVDPAMEAAVKILEKFAEDVTTGKVSRRILRHGAPWRHPPSNCEKQKQWARIQLLDYIQALADTEFGVNHRDPKAQELLEDPSTDALLQVGLFYQQKELPYLRPITAGVSRCLVRWQVRERLNMSFSEQLKYAWHRLIRGRYYKQLVVI